MTMFHEQPGTRREVEDAGRRQYDIEAQATMGMTAVIETTLTIHTTLTMTFQDLEGRSLPVAAALGGTVARHGTAVRPAGHPVA